MKPRASIRGLATGCMALTTLALNGCGDRTGEGGDGGHYDVLLRGGEVLDGSGGASRRMDVAVTGDRIAAMGDLSAADADLVIDVSGLIVTPGFIDVHSHSGPGLASEGLSHGQPLLAQGVTTVFVNPDGGGPTDIDEQRTALLEHGLGVNVAQFVPHGSVRRAVMGEEDRSPSPGELQAMRDLVRAGMEAGAWGLSSGTFYVPGSYSDNSEIIELARVVAEFGGAYSSHIRDESNYTIGVVAAVDEVIDVGRQAGIPAVVTHVKALGPPVWGASAEIIRHIEDARNEGLSVFADQYPYEASATSLRAALLPRWSQAGGGDSLLARMNLPETMDRIREGMVENLARRGGADRIQFRRFVQDESLEGRLLSDVAAERDMDPIDVAADLFRLGSPSIVSFNMSEDDVRTLMRQPWTMTASDGDLVPWMEGVPHPRSYGTFSRKLQRFVVEESVVDLTSAIRSMTTLPAEVFDIEGRGALREGMLADIAVFDLARVRELATFTEPHQLSEGMVWVFVNGRVVVENGAFTGTSAGRVLSHVAPASN